MPEPTTSVLLPGAGEPATATSTRPPALSPYQQVDQDVKGLLTRSATWQAPGSLTVGHTDNVALAIGDAQALQDKIEATVPTVLPRPPESITIGSIVRAKLTANSSDAEITPLEEQNDSIGEQTRVLFAWQVKPLVAGELTLTAYIECPLSDGHVTTQIVPLRIPVLPAAQPEVSIGDRAHGLLDAMKSYWAQLTALAAGLLTAARLGWRWYRRRGDNGPVLRVENGADAGRTSPTESDGKPSP